MSNLILAVEDDERVMIGDNVCVSVRYRKGKRSSLIVTAPKEVRIERIGKTTFEEYRDGQKEYSRTNR